MKISYSKQFRTIVIRWGTFGIITGLTGLDRPSVTWHLVVKWRFLQCWYRERKS